jgi:hypothetical protein
MTYAPEDMRAIDQLVRCKWWFSGFPNENPEHQSAKAAFKRARCTMDAQPEPDQVTEAEYGNARDDRTLERAAHFHRDRKSARNPFAEALTEMEDDS